MDPAAQLAEFLHTRRALLRPEDAGAGELEPEFQTPQVLDDSDQRLVVYQPRRGSSGEAGLPALGEQVAAGRSRAVRRGL